SGVAQTIYDPLSYDPQANTRDPFPNNIIPTGRIDPVSAQAATLYPATNRPGVTQNYFANAPVPEDQNRGDVRIDHVFGANDNVFFRYSRQKELVGNSPRWPSTLDGNGTQFDHIGDNMGFSWSHIFSPSLITNIKLGWNRIFTIRTAVVDENFNQKFGINGVNQSLPGMALLNISGVQNLGLSNYTPNIADSQSRQLKVDTSWTKGKHTVKFGLSTQFLQSYLTNPQQSLGNFTFNGNYTRQSAPGGDRGGRPVADFLLGTAFRSNISNSVYMNLRAPWTHVYVQDDWRMSNKLTVNLGLRYEYSPPWAEKDNLISNFDIDTNPADPSFLVAGSAGSGRFGRALMKNDTNNLAPRFGFAYQALPGTVIRGGYGIFYANYEGTGGGQYLETNPPFHIKSEISTNSIDPTILLHNGNPPGVVTPENAVSLSFSSFELTPDWPMSQQWNFNIQHSLFRDTVLEIGYYGTKSQHLVNRLDGNYALPGPGNINSRRRYTSTIFPGTDIVVGPLAAMNRHEFNGNSLFHSMQTRLEKRFSNGFTFLGAYVFGRTIGDVSGFSGSGNSPNSGIQNPRNRKAERSLDNQHRKHSFTASYVYELPFGNGRKFGADMHRALDFVVGGWSVAGIHSIATGQPFGLSVRGNPANTGQLNRPNVVAGVDPVLPSDQRDPQLWFNTDAFVPNNEFEYGNAGRNVLIGPGRFNWDFALYKQFRVTETKLFQFRFEAFNFTNTPNFGFPKS
ncbi:MAG: TonB-dependent receptor, partial [Bryobacterales bacterium]